MMKSRTFKVGVKYRHKPSGLLFICELGQHPWERGNKFLMRNTRLGGKTGGHVSQFKRTEFVLAKDKS